MKHDLNAINAAWRLGDRAYPPRNCIIQCRIGMYRADCDCTCRVIGRIRANGGNEVLVSCLDGGVYHYIRCNSIIEFISIPEEVPSFAEWERI
jgi:hypothetical protein